MPFAGTMKGIRADLRKHLLSLLPRPQDFTVMKHHWKGDIPAGITVGVVALPLALAFGVSSGVGAAAGLVTAIIAGLVAAIFGGSNLQVSGPTGAMVVIIAPLVVTHGAAAAPLLSVLAGVIVILGGSARYGTSNLLDPLARYRGASRSGSPRSLRYSRSPTPSALRRRVGPIRCWRLLRRSRSRRGRKLRGRFS